MQESLPPRRTRAREALSVGENYGAALDKLLSLLENEPGNNRKEIERVLKFKELLVKEQELLKLRPHTPEPRG